MFRDVQNGVANDIIGVARFITIGTTKFSEATEVRAQFILVLAGNVRVKDTTPFTGTSTDLRVSSRIWL